MALTPLEEILKMWERDDAPFDSFLTIEQDTKHIAKLHAKYLRFRAEHNLRAAQLEQDLKSLKRNKSIWYTGKMSREALEALKWDQYQGMKLAEKARDKMVDSEPEVIKMNLQLAYHSTARDTCSDIIWQIKDRTTQVRTIVDYQRFTSGA